jgi:hypothetical protein
VRARRLRWVFLLVALMAACNTPTGRSFEAEFPEVVLDPEFEVVMEAIGVNLHDSTGMVDTFGVLVPAADDPLQEGVSAQPADPRTLHVHWFGGSCTDRIQIVLSGDVSSGYAIEIEEQPPMFMLGCAGVGISRAVAIRLIEPVSPDEVSFAVEPQ